MNDRNADIIFPVYDTYLVLRIYDNMVTDILYPSSVRESQI